MVIARIRGQGAKLRDKEMDMQRVEDTAQVNTENPLDISALHTPEERTAFRVLNEEWIKRYFVMEKSDVDTLNDPDGSILNKGGFIYIARLNGVIVGCAALVPLAGGVYELSKMAVAPEHRGAGIGRKLLVYTISQAKVIGARSLFLGSSTKLQNAVHLYESVGFEHVPPEQIPHMPYTRADVFMQMQF